MLDLTAKGSTFNFGAGQTVAGFGTVNIGSGKTLSFIGGGTLAPGGSIGTLSVIGNVNLTGGVAAFELGASGATHAAAGVSDMTAITGNLTLGGTLNLLDNGGANGQGSAGLGYYKLFTYTGTESGSFASTTGWGVGSSGTHIAVDNVPADKAVYYDVTQFAAANNPLTVAPFGNVHEGSTVTQPVSVTNTTTGSFVDTLAPPGERLRPASLSPVRFLALAAALPTARV